MRDKKVIILIILIAIAVFSFSRSMRVPATRTVPAEDAIVVRLADTSSDLSVARNAKRTKFTSWKRSPFVSYDFSSKKHAGLMLQGIAWDDDKPTAIINNEIVSPGGKIGDVTVIAIERESVILNDGKSNFKLMLKEE